MRRWTEREELVLMKNVNSSDTLREAFEKSSKMLNRTEAACALHWQKAIKGEDDSKIFEWDDKSKKVLERYIKANPGNLSEAFRLTAKKLYLPYKTVVGAFYRKSSPVYREKLACCFVLVGSKRAVKNKKNLSSGKMEDKKSFLKRFWRFFRG